jgi:hypothetical protein
MSCSPVKVEGVGPPTTTTPKGSPILIANLQAHPGLAPSEDPIAAKCYTVEGTSILFPAKYKEVQPVIRAPKTLNLQAFSKKDNPTCGSDNPDTLKALRKPNYGIVIHAEVL